MSNKKEITQHIFTGTGLSVLAGATTGATLAVLKNGSVKAYATSTGANCGVFGATFFIIRESFLSYQRKQNPMYGLKDSETRDIDDLVSSAMAGVTTGGLLSAAFRGSKGVLPGCILFGTICTGGQLIYSAANRWRQDTIVHSGLVDLPADQDIPTKNLAKSVWDAIEIPSWSPIRKLSNDEYNALLDAKLKTLEDDIQQIEREMKRSAQDSTKND